MENSRLIVLCAALAAVPGAGLSQTRPIELPNFGRAHSNQNVIQTTGNCAARQAPTPAPVAHLRLPDFAVESAQFHGYSAHSTSALLVRQANNAIFAGFVTLGFAMARANCAGSDTLSGDVLALMQQDLTNTANSMMATSAVIAFDVDRVRNIRDSLPSMTGDQADNELMDLFNSSLQAIQDARLNCQQSGSSVVPPAMENLATVGTRLGIVSALAMCFPCNESIADDVASFMSDQLNTAASELEAFAGCINGFDFGQFSTVPLGSPYTSLQSYVPLNGLIESIAQSILANDCTCSAS